MSMRKFKKHELELKIVPRKVPLSRSIKYYHREGWDCLLVRHKLEISELIGCGYDKLEPEDIEEYVIYRLYKLGFTEEAIFEYYSRKHVHSPLSERELEKLFLRVKSQIDSENALKYSTGHEKFLERDTSNLLGFMKLLAQMIDLEHPILVEAIKEDYVLHTSSRNTINIDPDIAYTLAYKFSVFSRQPISPKVNIINTYRYCSNQNHILAIRQEDKRFPYVRHVTARIYRNKKRYIWMFDRRILLDMGYWTINDIDLIDFKGNLIEKKS